MSKNELHILNGRTAGFVTRLFAYVLDIAIVAGILALGGWIAVLIDNVIENVGLDPRVDMAAIYVVLIALVVGLILRTRRRAALYEEIIEDDYRRLEDRLDD